GCCWRSSGGTPAAASPMISTSLTSPSCSSRLLRRSPSALPAASITASRAWSSMWRKRTVLLRRDVEHLRFIHYLIAIVWADEACGIHVHFPTQERRKLTLHPREAHEPHGLTLLKLHQHIHVALRPEVL